MIRAILCGRHLPDLRRILAGFPIREVTERPDLVISYGGDGALLGAERTYPGVPKLPLRDQRSNPACPAHGEAWVLDGLVAGRLKEARLLKLEAEIAGRRAAPLTAVNDIVVHNRVIPSAVRYRVWLDDELYANQAVGDGLVAATPFGSSGYYRSITHSIFRTGIGLAFNNSTEPTHHLVIPDTVAVRVQILRGPAVLLADNAPVRLQLAAGAEVRIRRSPHAATVFGLDIFRCPICARQRQDNPDPV
ncbi:MAG: hypothetical protein WC708_04920 [Lentisphaeria bacterium]